MTLRKFDPSTVLTIEVSCASCGRTVPPGEGVRRTRGPMRHQGGWLCRSCWRHS